MAGIGDSWGTREELLHPRDSKGRFRSKWKMSESVLNAVLAITQNFSPRTFASDGQATQYTQNLAHQKPGRFQGGKGYARLQADFENANNDLLDGTPDEPSTKKFVDMMDKSMIEAPDSFIASSVVGADAFGLTPETLGSLEEMTGNVIANRGYTAVNLGTPLGGGAGMITMSIATPKGTKIAVPGRNPGDRAIYMDRDQEFTVTKVKPDGRGGYYMWAVATPATPGENPGPEGGHAGSGHSGNREADIKALGDTQMKRDMGEQGVSQLPGGEAAGGQPEDQLGRVVPAAQAGDDPATERARRRAAILGRPAAPAEQSQAPAPAAPPAGAPAPEANVPEAVTPAPSGVQPPNGATSTATGEAQASFRDKINDANLEAPSKAARKDFNDAITAVESGKRNPADIERDLKADIADLKRQAGQEGTDTEQLNADADKLQKLSDVIGDHFQTPGRSRTTGEPVEVQSAEKPITKAPKDAPARGPKSQMTEGERSDFEKKIDARLATKAPSKKPAPTPPRPPSEVEIRAEKQKALLNDTGARPAASKKVNPKKIGVKAPEGNQLQRDMEDDRLNAEQRTEWSNELGPEPAILKKQAGGILLDEVADLLRNGRITKPKAAARLRDQAREDEDMGADYLRRAADLIESDTSKAKKRVPLKPKRGVVPDEAEASLEGRTERNILTGLNQLDVGNLRGLADKWGIETRGEDKKLKTKAVLAKELAAHWKATPSLQKKAPEAEAVDELDELLLPQLKERAKAEGIKLNSKMRKAEILAALKLKRDGGGDDEAPADEVPDLAPADLKRYEKLRDQGVGREEAIDAVVDMTPVPAKKVTKKAAAKKLPPGAMTPEEFAEASPRILAGEDVDAVGRDILGRRGAAAELDLPIEDTGPDIADAPTVQKRLQEIGDTGNNADAIAYMDGLKLSAKDLRLLANDLGVGDTVGSKDTKAQVRDKLINIFATGRQNTRAIKNALSRERGNRDNLIPELAEPKTPEAKDLAAVAQAPEVPKPIAKAAAKAAKAADKAADTADQVSEMYDPKVGTADLKTIDDLSTEDRIAVSMLNINGGKNRTAILLAMSKEHPEEAKRVLKAEQIMAAAEAERHGPLTPEDRITLTYLKLAEKQPGLREKILRENPHRDRILNAEKLLAAEEAGEAPPVPVKAVKKAVKKVTAKVMDEVVQEAKEKVATTAGPKKVTPWDRVTAHVMKRIGEIDPDMRNRVMEELPEKERDNLLDIEHRVELQRTRVKKGGGDLDQILEDSGIDVPGGTSESRFAYEQVRDLVANGATPQAIKHLKLEQANAKRTREDLEKIVANPGMSPAARADAGRMVQLQAGRESWAASVLEKLDQAPEVDKKPGPLVKKAVENVVISLPESERESWNSATVDGLRKAAAVGGIELPDGITTKEEALQEVIKELARRKLAGQELPSFEAPEAPRAPEPTLPKASANIKGDTVEGHPYRDAVRRLESGDITPTQAGKEMFETARAHQATANDYKPEARFGRIMAPEARAAAQEREMDLSRQYDEAAKELRARKRVPKPAVVAEVLDQASNQVAGVPEPGSDAELINFMNTVQSPVEAANRLKGMKRQELVEFAKLAKVHHPANANMASIRSTLVQQLVQRRLNSDAISKPAPPRLAGESVGDWARRTTEPRGESVGETLARARGPIAPEATAPGPAMTAFADPALVDAMAKLPVPSADAPQKGLVEQLTRFENPISRDQAAELLAPLSKTRLLEINDDPKTLTVPGAKRMSAVNLRKEMVEANVGSRLDSIATRGFTGIRPGDESTTTAARLEERRKFGGALTRPTAETPAPAKKATKKAAAAAAEDATVRGLQRMAEGGFRDESALGRVLENQRQAAKKTAPSVEAQVETRMDIAKATKAATPAAPAGDVPQSAGGFTHAELMDLGPARLKEMEDDLGITRRSLDRSDRADDILRALAAQPPKADGGGRSTPAKKTAPPAAKPVGAAVNRAPHNFIDAGQGRLKKVERANADEPLYLPNGGVDQGNIHMDSEIGGLWQDLVADPREPNSFVNKIAKMGDEMGRHRLGLAEFVDRLKEMKDQAADSGVADRIQSTIDAVDAPPAGDLDLPSDLPAPLRKAIEDLAKIPTARKRNARIGADRVGSQSVLDKKLAIIRDLAVGDSTLDKERSSEIERKLFQRDLHESADAASTMWKAFEDISRNKEVQAWIRDKLRAIRARGEGA